MRASLSQRLHSGLSLSSSERSPHLSVFQDEFREDLRYWVDVDHKTAIRILSLVEAVMRDPFSGIGKPEPLKHLGGGLWSRRITQEHRLVYLVREGRIDFVMCRYHY
jgi:toxin YoeB